SYKVKQRIDANSTGFIETNDGHMILLGWGGDGLYFFDSTLTQVPELYGYKPSDVKDPDYDYLLTWCGLQDSKGTIWVGCQHGRLIKLDPVSRKVTRLHLPEFENHTIRCMVEDKNGNIWFGTQHNVIVKWTRSTNTYKQVVPGSPEKYQLGWVISIVAGY